MLSQLIEITQVPAQLRYMVQKRNVLRAIGTTLAGAGTSKAVESLLDGVFDLEGMNSIARQHFMDNMDFAVARRAAALFSASPQSLLLQMESAAGAPGQKEHFRAHFEDPGDSASEERVGLMSAIDDLVHATRWMSSFHELLSEKLVAALAGQVEAGKLTDADLCTIRTQLQQQASAYRESHPGTLLLLYAYRDVKTEDLEAYIANLETPEGRWLMEVSRGALIAGIRPSIERFAQNTVAVL